jgi:hypothetical protein
MINILGYLDLWQSLKYRNSKVSKTECGSDLMTGKLSHFSTGEGDFIASSDPGNFHVQHECIPVAFSSV